MLGKSILTFSTAAVLILMIWPPGALGQASLSVGSAPTSRVCQNDSNAPAGDIFISSFVGPNGTSDGSSIQVSYLVPISNSASVPPGLNVSVDATGSFSGRISSVTVDNSAGTVVIVLRGLPANADPGTLTIRNVRINLSSFFSPGYASVSGSGFSLVAGQTTPIIFVSEVSCASQPAATITNVSPATAAQGAQVSATITGLNMLDANGSFNGPFILFSGTGVTATRGTPFTDSSLPISITVDSNAAPGSRTMFVTKLGSVSNALTFTITATTSKKVRAQVTSQ